MQNTNFSIFRNSNSTYCEYSSFRYNTKHIEQNNFISKYQFDISENTLIMQSVFANESDNLERKN